MGKRFTIDEKRYSSAHVTRAAVSAIVDDITTVGRQWYPGQNQRRTDRRCSRSRAWKTEERRTTERLPPTAKGSEALAQSRYHSHCWFLAARAISSPRLEAHGVWPSSDVGAEGRNPHGSGGDKSQKSCTTPSPDVLPQDTPYTAIGVATCL